MAASAIIFPFIFSTINSPSTHHSIHLSLSTCTKSSLNLTANTLFIPSVMAKAIFMLILLTLFVQHRECSSRGASSVEILRRQLFVEMKKNMALKDLVLDHGSSGNKDLSEDWQLRRVPAGPDPLHHNGQDPNKPRTP